MQSLRNFTALLLFLCLGVSSVNAQDFYIIDSGEDLRQLDGDTLTPVLLGVLPERSPNIAVDPDTGLIYVNDMCGSQLRVISLDPFAVVDTIPLNNMPTPVGENPHNTVASMTFIDGTLYASTSECGPENRESALVTIDLDTGDVTEIGYSGLAHWTTGMAYDQVTETLYGLTGTNNLNSQFFTLDPTTGVPSNIVQITFNGNQVDSTTGLTLAEDNQLYAVINNNAGGTSRTNLYTIDRITGALTDMGNTDIDMSGIASIQGGPVLPPPPAAPAHAVPASSMISLALLATLLLLLGTWQVAILRK